MALIIRSGTIRNCMQSITSGSLSSSFPAAAQTQSIVQSSNLKLHCNALTNSKISQGFIIPMRNCSSQPAKQEPRPDKLYSEIEIELRAHDPAVLKSYSWFMNSAANELEINVTKSHAPENSYKQLKTLLRSAFVHKKQRVQYEYRTFYHFFTLKHLTGSTADTYLEYVQRNLPEGVSMKVIKTELQRKLPHLNPPTAAK
eukprot:TRINITY_DN16683_c0_g1_i1.p1 TRINITY_DN16683_c0_g1~~TRINITY_DN16683_c0_g1_i1.p1  ORF type:complete len:200 (+),score=13.35 TRINITY_DN16683_c0_g1_i1:34-633(+)